MSRYRLYCRKDPLALEEIIAVTDDFADLLSEGISAACAAGHTTGLRWVQTAATVWHLNGDQGDTGVKIIEIWKRNGS